MREALAVLGGSLASAGLVAAVVYAGTRSGGAATSVAVAGAVASVVLVVVLAARKASPRRIARERRWVAALPFALQRYFETLARDPDVLWMTISLRLSWRGARPDAGANAELLANIVAAIDPKATVASDVIELAMDSEDDSLLSNRDIVRWTHKITERVLVPLHQTYALASARLQRK